MTKRYSSLNLFIRSSIFSIFSILFIITVSSAATLSIVLPLSARFFIICSSLRFYILMLRLICHIKYQVEGLENIPKDMPVVVMCKHQSTWETFFLPTIFRQVTMIAKRELLWMPFFGWGFAASQPITIDRKNKSSAMQQIINKGKACLAAGRDIIAFPEGTRVPSGVVGHYRLGAARLIVATESPFICIAHNAGRYWPRRTFIKRPGTIHMIISPVTFPQGKSAEDILSLAKEWIEGQMIKIESTS